MNVPEWVNLKLATLSDSATYANTVRFLAHRTNDRVYAIVLRLSVCRLSSVTLCIVAKQCILEQKLISAA